MKGEKRINYFLFCIAVMKMLKKQNGFMYFLSPYCYDYASINRVDISSIEKE